ncbi:MAG: class I SAM-dependent methyltransferase [Deltaproteobacteria bacterium]|nr:class I SAM-dependent methyltransferase [Deltaproteobacteria bacterium]
MGPCIPGQVTGRSGDQFTVRLLTGAPVVAALSDSMVSRGILVEPGQWVAVLGDRIIYRWKDLQVMANIDWPALIREIPSGLLASRGCHDAQAEHYEEEVRAGLNDYIRENYFAILDRVIELAEIGEDMTVLDIGIGTGLLSERVPGGANLHGIDISPKMLEKVREKGLPVKLVEGSFLAIPYPDQTFDRIISTFAFHHLTPMEKVLGFKEMDRVLKPKGRIVIGDLMVENARQMDELRQRFVREGRTDLLEELEDEYFTDLELATQTLASLGYETAWERGSVLSLILSAKSTDGFPAK